MKSNMMKIGMMIILAAGSMIAAGSAQGEIRDPHAKGLIYDGVETSAGNQDPVSGFQYGTTYVLSSLGEVESRYMTASVNSRELFKGFTVTGGVWSLAVFRDGVFVGSVYGDAVSGDIQEIINKKGELIGRQTRIDLQGTGGTGIFENEESQEIKGSLTMTTDLLTKKKRTIAVETLNF